MPSPTVVFDLDGTLIDTAPDLIDTLNLILGRHDVAPVPFKEARTMVGAGVKPLLQRGLAANGVQLPPEEMDRLYAEYLEVYAAHIADRSRPFPGLERALDALAAQGYRLAVCTNKLEWLSVKLLKELGLAQRFTAICGQDTFTMRKPDPDMLRLTIVRAGGDTRHALLVGDSMTDLATARAICIDRIPVEFG